MLSKNASLLERDQMTLMRTFRDICDMRSLSHTCGDSWGGDIIAAACTQIGATVKSRLLESEVQYDPTSLVKIVDGHVALPEGPGLGVNPDAAQFGAPVASF